MPPILGPISHVQYKSTRIMSMSAMLTEKLRTSSAHAVNEVYNDYLGNVLPFLNQRPGSLKFRNLHVFEWDMGHWPILRAHHHFWA